MTVAMTLLLGATIVALLPMSRRSRPIRCSVMGALMAGAPLLVSAVLLGALSVLTIAATAVS